MYLCLVMMTLFLIFLLAIGASFIQRVSGFGFGIFVMMFFPYIIASYGEATMLSGLLAGSTALIIAVRNLRYIQWRKMFPLLVVNIAVSYFTIEYMASLSTGALKRFFGAMFVMVALYFLFFDGKMKLPHNRTTKGVLGAISGVMGGMFAMPGPPLVLYCINCIDGKMEYVATMQAFSVILNLFYSVFRSQVGFAAEDMLLWWVVGLAGVVIGSYTGSLFFDKISASWLKRLVYMFLLVSGVVSML